MEPCLAVTRALENLDLKQLFSIFLEGEEGVC